MYFKWFPYSARNIIIKFGKVETQKSNFGCRPARKTKEAKIKNNKTLLYITMTMTININNFINKIMSLRASLN